jgi:hypothetical protein
MTRPDPQFCFLVGSPRSGTTAVAAALARHPEIAHFYEPYFLWERWLRSHDDDHIDPETVTSTAANRIREEYDVFARKSSARVVVDKTPENAFRIEAIRRVFPEARFLHLVRDGRDVTASIRREWQRRQAVVAGQNTRAMLGLAWRMLARQPYWRHRLQALRHELGRRPWWPPSALLNKAKWDGAVGWGPRFPGWRAGREQLEPMAFHALQWRRSIEAVEQSLATMPAGQALTVRYEQVVTAPAETMGRIEAFLGFDPGADRPRGLNTGRIGAWRDALSADELDLVERTVDDKLRALGYKDANE